jgi:HK97 family phage major capsid protein
MTTEEVVKALEDKLESKGFASKSDVDTIKASIEELKTVADQTELKAAFDKLEGEIAALKEVSASVGRDRSMTPIKRALVENKERIAALKSNGGKFEVEVDLETKATHNPTDIGNRNELGQFETGVSKIPHRKVYMEQLFEQGTASTEYIKYVEEATVVRDAKNVAACATSTHNSKVTFDVKDLQMKKVRDFTHVCIDMMDDYAFVETEIRHLVTSGVQLKKDADLLLADGTGANINGVDSYASTFSASASGANYANTVFTPQLIDLLVVAGAQIKAFGQQNFFMPNVIILNPKDATLMGLLKDGQENYIKMGSVNASVFRDANGQLYINGMLVVENPNCPENEAYIFDSTKGRYYRRRGMVVEFAYENGTNFEQELVTVKAYERGNLRVRNNDANAFMHIDDIAAGIAAIERT